MRILYMGWIAIFYIAFLYVVTLNAYTEIESLSSQEWVVYKGVEKKNMVEPIIEKKHVVFRSISAYNAGDINQCSGDPCISANGENVCKLLELGEKVCAANFVPFNTILEIEHYGQCRVIDRLASRYSQSVDIAMKLSEKKRALKFGRQILGVRIIK